MTVSADLHTLTRVWMGDLDLTDALRSGDLKLEGSTSLRLSFPDWIGLSLFANIQPARDARTHSPNI